VNPVEHIWDDIRKNHGVNRVFPSLDAVEDGLREGISDLARQPEYLKSLANFPYLHITF